jgi:class 3 adenylate cyclase
VFTGEQREVTVMFVNHRDFTPFAEANPAEDVVAHLNALFEIVVPAVVEAGGHISKFLGNAGARVEQLTKTTGDAILLTEQSVGALSA